MEEKYFHYQCNSDSDADFKEAGVELKVTPYKVNKDGKQVAKERVSLTMINYMDVVNETFYNSHLWKKCGLILFIWYQYNGKDASPFNQSIDYVQLFTGIADLKKEGGKYINKTGKVKTLDLVNGYIKMIDNEKIYFEDITEIVIL